ncbi:hypothetical protein DUD43_08940 [Alcaligenes faecalis]|uniref:hypothetical protein n=1 Tax=Alcaligenes faecalis TaxID=511 RepID=UPI001293AB26|nr:hypothetical protein [Alcaligenes faecalis]QFY77798.1 hypothetical protein DUD43_08940 [Alcaligenes faecalis]
MKFNRNVQRSILELLRESYPGDMEHPHLKGLIDAKHQEDGDYDFYANLVYLREHGLISFRAAEYDTDEEGAVITNRGIDFLAEDGGLSAILGVMTIKIHDDTLKSLIEGKILRSDLSQPDKKRWLDSLRELPAETTKHLVLKLVDLGLANSPTALAAIGTALGLGTVG